MNQSWEQTVAWSSVDGTALTAAATASLLPLSGVFTLPANAFTYVGQQLLIEASGRITSVITTPGTARFLVTLGGTTVFDSLAILLDSVAAHTNVGWYLRVLMTLRTIGNGANSNFMGQGTWVCEDILGVQATFPGAAAVAVLPWNSAPAVGGNIDVTGALALGLSFTQTAATGSILCSQFSAVLKN